MDGALINFDQSHDMVWTTYLEAFHIMTCFGPVFRGWNTAWYKGIRSVVRGNGNLSKLFEITL